MSDIIEKIFNGQNTIPIAIAILGSLLVATYFYLKTKELNEKLKKIDEKVAKYDDQITKMDSALSNVMPVVEQLYLGSPLNPLNKVKQGETKLMTPDAFGENNTIKVNNMSEQVIDEEELDELLAAEIAELSTPKKEKVVFASVEVVVPKVVEVVVPKVVEDEVVVPKIIIEDVDEDEDDE